MFSRSIALLTTVAATALLTSCSGGHGATALPPAQGIVGAPAPAPGGGNAPVSTVTYAPHVTVYAQNYQHFWTCSAFPCGPSAPPVPFGPLAVNGSGTVFYFFDENYDTVELNNGTWSAYVMRTYDNNGTSVNSGDLWAFDESGTLYTLGSTTANASHLVSRADSASGQVFTPVTGSFDLEASSIPGRMLLADSSGFHIIDGANAHGTVRTIVPPTSNNCVYRVVEGIDHEIDVSNCESFNQIFRYSADGTLLASATVNNASHINEIAPDPDGGVWFADDGVPSAVGLPRFGRRDRQQRQRLAFAFQRKHGLSWPGFGERHYYAVFVAPSALPSRVSARHIRRKWMPSGSTLLSGRRR